MIAFKIFFRELKNNKKYWMFFTANLCVGLVGFTFIFLLRANLSQAIDMRAETLLSAELAVSGRRELSQEEMESIKGILGTQVKMSTSSRELYSMGNVQGPLRAQSSRLLLIKGIEKNFPLIGEIILENKGLLNSKLLTEIENKPLVILSPELISQMGLRVGDKLTLGVLEFEIIDVIKSDTTSSLRGVNLAPKVYIGNKFLDQTGLLSFGTVAYYSRFYTFKKNTDPKKIKQEIFQTISDPGMRVKTAQKK